LSGTNLDLRRDRDFASAAIRQLNQRRLVLNVNNLADGLFVGIHSLTLAPVALAQRSRCAPLKAGTRTPN
jgi:hypothetical protein